MISFRSIREEFEARLRPSDPAGPWSEASGKIEWKLDGQGAATLKLRLRKLPCPDGTLLALSIGHRPCGDLVVEKGRAELSYDSRRAEPVPEVRAQHLAELQLDGSAVLEGNFVPD